VRDGEGGTREGRHRQGDFFVYMVGPAGIGVGMPAVGDKIKSFFLAETLSKLRFFGTS
jgi:hypothetical protein